MGGNRGVMNYNKFGRRTSDGRRCFRLYPRRFSVQRLRAKFVYLIRLFKRGIARSFFGRKKPRTESRRNLVVVQKTEHRMKSFGRSNSFYSEAIADCLEFIKRSSVSMDEYKSIDQITE